MVHPLLEKRHSLRAFDETKKLTDDDINNLVKAARLAPSCYNDQPWVFLFCSKEKNSEGWNKVFSTLVEFNQGWAKAADLLVVVFARMTFLKNGKPNRWGPYDSGAAAYSLTLEAANLGLMAHQMGGFNEGQLKAAFNVPDNLVPYAVIGIGKEPHGIEIPKKDRLDFKENFFEGDLATPITLG